VIDGSFPQSVAELRAALERLRAELKRLDSVGDRRGSIRVLGQMIAMQKSFMERWPVAAAAHGTNAEQRDQLPAVPDRRAAPTTGKG
jgi:hypothetical protein